MSLQQFFKKIQMVSSELNICFEVLENIKTLLIGSSARHPSKLCFQFLFVFSVFYCSPFTVQHIFICHIYPPKIIIIKNEHNVKQEKEEWARTIWNGNSLCRKNINRYLFLLSTTDFYDFYADDK